MQTGIVSGFWFRGRSWRFKIHFWRNIVRFWKSYIGSNKLDVQQTNFSFTQFNRIRNHLFGHWTKIGWVACSGIMGSNCFCSWKCFSRFRSIGTNVHKRHKAQKEDWCDGRHWFCSFKCLICASRSFIACVWGQWSSDQDDHQRKESYNETCFQNPQNCTWLVVWSN